MMVAPDFNRIRKTLLLQGEPDRVPIMESHIDRDVKKAFLGRPARDLEDDVEFWMTAGYDYVPLGIGMRSSVRASTGMLQADLGTTSQLQRHEGGRLQIRKIPDPDLKDRCLLHEA